MREARGCLGTERDLSSKWPWYLALLSPVPFSVVMLQRYKEAFCCLIITFLMKGLSY